MNRSIHEFDNLPSRENGSRGRRSSAEQNTGTMRIGLVYNPRSHLNRGKDLDCTKDERVLVAQPEKREDIAEALERFADAGIGYLMINGGDGTVRDVLTAAVPVFGEDMPPLAVLPKGKTNALNVDLGAPKDWNVADAIAAFETGTRVRRRPLEIASADGDSGPVRGFILGAGAFTLGTSAGQDAHSFGLFNSLAVGMTGAWGVLQALFGSDNNPWRRGVEMEIVLQPQGEPLVHSGHGDPARREIVLVTTLRKLPVGIKPFGPERDGLKLAVMDKPRRRLVASLPMVLAGWQSPWLAKTGFHQVDAEGFDFAIGDKFILDGEAFPPGRYTVRQGPELTFVTA